MRALGLDIGDRSSAGESVPQLVIFGLWELLLFLSGYNLADRSVFVPA
jgi:hypothetical protein